MNPQIKFQPLHPGFVLPQKAHGTDAMYDVVATTSFATDDYVEYGMGFATEIPEGWAGYFYPRSSISNYDLSLCNSVGIIDAGYRGEWKARFRFHKQDMGLGVVGALLSSAQAYGVGDRIGQICFAPLPKYDLVLADSLSSTQRGAGGFGSTDK